MARIISRQSCRLSTLQKEYQIFFEHDGIDSLHCLIGDYDNINAKLNFKSTMKRTQENMILSIEPPKDLFGVNQEDMILSNLKSYIDQINSELLIGSFNIIEKGTNLIFTIKQPNQSSENQL